VYIVRCVPKRCPPSGIPRHHRGTGALAIEPRNQESGTPTLLSEAEGNTVHCAKASNVPVPRGRQKPGTLGSFLHRSWEISSASVDATDGAAKAKGHTAVIAVEEKSDARELDPGCR